MDSPSQMTLMQCNTQQACKCQDNLASLLNALDLGRYVTASFRKATKSPSQKANYML